jgi:amino acid adenylation domain-containing protein
MFNKKTLPPENDWEVGSCVSYQLLQYYQNDRVKRDISVSPIVAAMAALSLQSREATDNRISIHFDHDFTAGLQTFGLHQGYSLFTVLLAGWSTLMSRLFGHGNVMISVPATGELCSERRDMLVDRQQLTLYLTEPLNTETLLAQIEAKISDIPLSFEQIAGRVVSGDCAVRRPVFQISFSRNHTAHDLAEISDTTKQQIEPSDFNLMLCKANGCLEGQLIYTAADADRETVRHYVVYWKQLLHGMMVDCYQPVQTLPLLPDSERRQILYDFNPISNENGTSQFIHQFVEQQAAHDPEMLAVIADNQSICYGELNRKSNQLAYWLMERKVRPESRIVIALPRGPEQMIAVLATLKSGGTVVPVDPNDSDERLQFILADSAPQVLISCNTILPRFGKLHDGLMVIDVHSVPRPWELGYIDNINPIHLGLKSHHLACIIYTSGLPKGVMIEHRGLCHLAGTHQETFSVGPGCRVLQLDTVHGDTSLFESMMGLCSGAELHLTEQQQGEPLLQVLRTREITHALLSLPALLGLNPTKPLPDLQVLITANNSGSPMQLAPWLDGRSVYTAYGLVETAGWASARLLTRSFDRSPLLGKPIINTPVYILDPQGEPVPIGVSGELYIGGNGVARGYLNRPELTAERFVDNPFDKQANARMFRTGDLGRWLPDGTIEYLGRTHNRSRSPDDQIRPGV